MIRKLAEDVEELFIHNENLYHQLVKAHNTLHKQRTIMLVSGAVVFGYALVETEKRRRAKLKEKTDNILKG